MLVCNNFAHWVYLRLSLHNWYLLVYANPLLSKTHALSKGFAKCVHIHDVGVVTLKSSYRNNNIFVGGSVGNHTTHKVPFTLEKLRAWRNEPSHWRNFLCILVHLSPDYYEELLIWIILLYLQYWGGTVVEFPWEYFIAFEGLLVKFKRHHGGHLGMSRVLTLVLWAWSQVNFKVILGLAWILFYSIPFPHWYLT